MAIDIIARGMAAAGSNVPSEVEFLIGTTSPIQAQLDGKLLNETPTLLKTASYTLSLTDKTTIQKCLSGSTILITIPLDSAVNFPIGSEIVFIRYGAGAVTLVVTSGVTLFSSGNKNSINAQYEAITIKKIAANEWVAIGALGV